MKLPNAALTGWIQQSETRFGYRRPRCKRPWNKATSERHVTSPETVLHPHKTYRPVAGIHRNTMRGCRSRRCVPRCLSCGSRSAGSTNAKDRAALVSGPVPPRQVETGIQVRQPRSTAAWSLAAQHGGHKRPKAIEPIGLPHWSQLSEPAAMSGI